MQLRRTVFYPMMVSFYTCFPLPLSGKSTLILRLLSFSLIFVAVGCMDGEVEEISRIVDDIDDFNDVLIVSK